MMPQVVAAGACLQGAEAVQWVGVHEDLEDLVDEAVVAVGKEINIFSNQASFCEQNNTPR